MPRYLVFLLRAIDAPFAEHGAPVLEVLPPFLFMRPFWVLELWQWLGLVLLVGAGALGSRALLLPPPAQRGLDLGARSLALVSAAWFVLRFVKLSARFIEQKVVGESGADEGRVRGLRTQLAVMRRIIEAATYVIAASLLLLQFEAVRNVGVSLLASAGIAGLVIGYKVDVAAVRAELTRVLHHEGRALWDGKAQGVQVTACSERTMTLRALVSAADAGKLWDLRCLVREQLIAFLQQGSQPLAAPAGRPGENVLVPRTRAP